VPRPAAPAPWNGILAPVRPLQQQGDLTDCDFLVGSVVDSDTLARARLEAMRCGVATHEALLAAGLAPASYASALARRLRIPLMGWEAALDLRTAKDAAHLGAAGLPAVVDGQPCRVLCAESRSPAELARQVAALQRHGIKVALATRRRLDAAAETYWRAQRLDLAVRRLHRLQPVDSAGGVMIYTWQLLAAAVACGLVIGGLTTAPDATLAALAGLAALPFLGIVLLRLAALGEVLLPAPSPWRRRRPGAPRLTEEELPFYSVLVPLCREAGMLPGLVQALQELNYPRAKLEILLVLEASDLDTQAALLRLALPPCFRTVLVPERPPHTKPKALNYALELARGEYVVVYDAEDRPQPDQLRRALEAFAASPPHTGCVQARLNIYNSRDSWLTRQLTVEYSALFDAILPALSRLGLPVPLGGTSNHLRRDTLIAVGGWDPFNVTEDADLGFRLARRGWRTTVVASTTWEEAPATFGSWLRQRTRWLKGWMQTYLVHTRRPLRLVADLGVRGTLGFHMLMGGLVLSALAHPLLYVLLAWQAAAGRLLAPAQTPLEAALWTAAWINLAAGYLASIAVGAASALRRGQPGLALSALLMPLCWLLVSAAAYRALYQLATDPYRWEKTEHGLQGQ
jgi:glycosyltransferase involved in cell wall biosynthesis